MRLQPGRVDGQVDLPQGLALVEAYAVALASARGSSPLLARARIAGSLLVRSVMPMHCAAPADAGLCVSCGWDSAVT